LDGQDIQNTVGTKEEGINKIVFSKTDSGIMAASEAKTKTDQNEMLLTELVAHFRKERENLRQQWLAEMTAKGLVAGLNKKELESESIAIYDACIGCLESGEYTGAEEYAKKKAERGVLKAMTAEQFFGGLLTLRDIYGISLYLRYKKDEARCLAALTLYEPVANKILSIVALAFVEGKEKIVRQQQQSILELSTPTLPIRPGILIVPIIGIIDTYRAKQLTEQLLKSIRANRAKIVVMDITGVPSIDSKVANHILQTVEAARLMGTRVIVSGLSPEIAQTIVTIGVDLSRVVTVSDLQSGFEEADQIMRSAVIGKRDERIPGV